MLVYLKKQVQIKMKAQGQDIIFDEAPMAVLAEYFDYRNIFLAEYAAELLEHTRMNNHAIELEKRKQSPFGLIYSLEIVELETLKTYIETNLVNKSIWASKSPARALILFN